MGNPVGAVLLAGAAAAACWLGFLAHAPNRLLSGVSIGLGAAWRLPASPAPAGGAALAGLLLVAAVLMSPRPVWRWLAIAAAGGFAAGITWLAGAAAATLAAQSPPAARTSLGAAYWVMLAAALLLAGDAAQKPRLRPPTAVLAAVLAAGPIALVLASGAAAELSLLREFANQRDVFFAAVLRHVQIVVAALLPTLLIGVPLGVAAQRRPALRRSLFPVLNIVQTIPSIAMFGLLMAPLSGLAALLPGLGRFGISGVGLAPAVIALLLYSLLPIVRNTVTGLDGVPADLRDAASGMGMTARQLFWYVDIPLALPVLLSGLRITAVQAVGLAAVAALIGAGGLGAIMFRGLFANALDLVLLGAIPVILMAVAVDALLRLLEALASRVRT